MAMSLVREKEREREREREEEIKRLWFFISWLCRKFQCWVTCKSSITRNLPLPYHYHLLIIYPCTEATEYIRLFEVQVGVGIKWDRFSFEFYLHLRYTYSFYPIISHGRYTFEIKDSDQVTHFIRDKVMIELTISSYWMLYITVGLKIRTLRF